MPFLRPTFPPADEIAQDYADIVASGTFSNGGPKERELSAAMACWIGGGVGATLTSSATTGLQLACTACFRPARRWVLVTSFTFAAGPLAARWCGFEPLFIDVDPATWQPDISAAESVLARDGRNVAGILLTSTFGVADERIDHWEALADGHGIPLVIDCAAGFGSCYASGEEAGAHGACEVFSLHATKTLAVGEGGVVTSRNGDLIARVERMKNFGFAAADGAMELGTNAQLAELPCAIGLRQLAALPERLARRRRGFEAYRAELAPLGILFQPGAEHSALPFVSALLPDASTRAALVTALDLAGIECRTYYNPPVHQQPFFAGSGREGNLTAVDDISRRIISLPMADDLSPDVASRVAAAARVVLGGG